MNEFARKLITEWRRLALPVEGETVVVGVSGGADSVSLLLGLYELVELKKLDLRIVAAHFNHRLRDGDSDADEAFVRGLTTERKIEFAVGHARERLDEGGNIEQNARNARYAFLRETAQNLDAYAILTGHTINDQAETFLINLIRGSGPDGLCGIRPMRAFEGERGRKGEEETVAAPPRSECDETAQLGEETHQNGLAPSLPFSPSPLLLVRPLVTWAKRRDTEGYCHSLGVEYRYDTMNEDTAFKRVRIRKILLPLLQDFNPNIIETLANTASLMQHIPQPDRDHGGNHSAAADELRIGDLAALDEAGLYSLLRVWLAKKRGTRRQLDLKHLQAIGRLVNSRRSGRVVELPGGLVIKSGGLLRFETNKVEK